VGRLLLKLAVPTVVAQLVNLLYNIVDRIYIGHMPEVGMTALTGIGLCFPVIYLIGAFTMLVAQGGAPRAAIAMGEGNNEKAEKIMGSCFTCLIGTAIALTALFWIFGEQLLWIFGCSEETIVYALPYMRIYSSGSIFVMMALGMNLFVTTQGFTTVSMRTVLIGAVSNIILDPIFIYAFDMGVQGAALATVISQAVSGIWVVRFLTGKRTTLRLRRGSLRPSWTLMAPVLALGVSPFVMQSTEALLSISFNSSLQRYGGDIAVGGHDHRQHGAADGVDSLPGPGPGSPAHYQLQLRREERQARQGRLLRPPEGQLRPDADLLAPGAAVPPGVHPHF